MLVSKQSKNIKELDVTANLLSWFLHSLDHNKQSTAFKWFRWFRFLPPGSLDSVASSFLCWCKRRDCHLDKANLPGHWWPSGWVCSHVPSWIYPAAQALAAGSQKQCRNWMSRACNCKAISSVFWPVEAYCSGWHVSCGSCNCWAKPGVFECTRVFALDAQSFLSRNGMRGRKHTLKVYFRSSWLARRCLFQHILFSKHEVKGR